MNWLTWIWLVPYFGFWQFSIQHMRSCVVVCLLFIKILTLSRMISYCVSECQTALCFCSAGKMVGSLKSFWSRLADTYPPSPPPSPLPSGCRCSAGTHCSSILQPPLPSRHGLKAAPHGCHQQRSVTVCVAGCEAILRRHFDKASWRVRQRCFIQTNNKVGLSPGFVVRRRPRSCSWPDAAIYRATLIARHFVW